MGKFIELPFGGADRKFRLALGDLRELQVSCKAGPATILSRLMAFQPQSEFLKRPRPQEYDLGEADPDYLAALNMFALVRQIGGDWRIDDVRETIRLGLIGGGTPTSEAYFYVTKYVDGADEWTANVGIAAQILAHALLGDQDDQPKKAETETTTQETDG